MDEDGAPEGRKTVRRKKAAADAQKRYELMNGDVIEEMTSSEEDESPATDLAAN